jgi:Domain of unknown function (DUF4350)
MSEIAIGEVDANDGAFHRTTMLVVTAIGVLAFLAMLVLGAYAPDLRSGKNGGAHALSNAATGFSGLVRLAEATGHDPVIVRTASELDSEDLAIITPESAGTDLSDILARRGSRVTLLILPKWLTSPDPTHAGWVRIVDLLPSFAPQGVLAPAYEFKILRTREKGAPLRTVHPTAAGEEFGLVAPEITQFLSGKDIEPVIVDPKGRIVLAKAKDRNLFVLADPDLLNNHGMADVRQAEAALALLDFLNSTDAKSILFDVTANGLGHSRSPLKLAFDPPFLAVTLVIFVAMLLAGWQALVRFGEPRRPQRAIAFGKAALVENSAALIRKAGRESALASRYVDTIRERAAALFRLPPSLKGEELDERLDALPSQSKFSELAAAAGSARHRDELLTAARRLNEWLKEVSA